jgi:transcriptional regulator with XRE-family HTH domain
MRAPGSSDEGFGALLRWHRSVSGLTQEELAERSMLSIRAIANMESGRTTRPYRRSVLRLAAALELPGPERELLEREARTGLPGQPARRDLGPAGGEANPGSGTRQRRRQSPAVPRQLPPTLARLAGRTRELNVLMSSLMAPARSNGTMKTLAVVGAPGVGKTTLALHWAHLVAHRFPDGQLYVDLRGFDPSGDPIAPDEAIRGLLDALGHPSAASRATPAARAGLYRSLLVNRSMLIVLDDARDAEQVRPLLPGNPSCLVVVTSRSQLTGLVAAHGAYPLLLDPLSQAGAVELLSHRLGENRLAREQRAVDEIAGLCARLPLALATVAARAAASPSLPLEALAAELRSPARRLDAMDTGDAATSLRTLYSCSYRQLSGPAAHMFRLLSVHPGPDITAPAAASLAAIPADQSRAVLRELVRCHLLTEHEPGRFALHDLLRAYAAERARIDDGRPGLRRAFLRALDHYAQAAQAAAAQLKWPDDDKVAPHPPRPGVTREAIADPGQAMAWFYAEHQVLDALTAQANGAEPDATLGRLQLALAVYLGRRGRWNGHAPGGQTPVQTVTRPGRPAARALPGAGHRDGLTVGEGDVG